MLAAGLLVTQYDGGDTYLDLSLMLICLGGILLSWGGEVAGDAPEEPHEDEPELDEDIELVLCLLDGIPWLSLLFTV